MQISLVILIRQSAGCTVLKAISAIFGALTEPKSDSEPPVPLFLYIVLYIVRAPPPAADPGEKA